MPDYTHPYYIPNVPLSDDDSVNPAPSDPAVVEPTDSTPATASSSSDIGENQPVPPVSPEVQRQAEKAAEEIVSLARIVEEMAQTRAKLEAALRGGEMVADALEGKGLKHVPGIKDIPIIRGIPIPADTLVGLIPYGAGDITTALISYRLIVIKAREAGVPEEETKKMVNRILIDLLGGTIPGLVGTAVAFVLAPIPVIGVPLGAAAGFMISSAGDIFDYFYKSNYKNIEIFKKYVQEYIAKHEALKAQLIEKQNNVQAQQRFEGAKKIPNTLG